MKKVDEASENSKIDEIKEEARKLEEENKPKNESTSSSNSTSISKTNKTADASTSQGSIRGNRKSKIYHSPGQAKYNKISPDNIVYFNSAAEAEAAGYRAAKK